MKLYFPLNSMHLLFIELFLTNLIAPTQLQLPVGEEVPEHRALECHRSIVRRTRRGNPGTSAKEPRGDSPCAYKETQTEGCRVATGPHGEDSASIPNSSFA